MTDINEWTLSYGAAGASPAVSLDFGLATSGFPFSTQMTMDDADRSNSDIQHGTDDAIMMGRDLMGGMNINFNFTTIPEGVDDINAALDAVSEFQAAWRAFGLSKVPGARALLDNNFRGRRVVGRPRNFSPKHGRMRKGIIEYAAQFRTVTPEFYSLVSTVVHPVRTVNLPATIGGDLPAFPIVTLQGKFTTATLQWFPGGLFSPWSLSVIQPLDTGDFIMIDTRAYARAAFDAAGQPRNGYLGGSRMSDCWLNPGNSGHFLFTTTGTTDASTSCTVEWFNTFAGL